MHREGSVTLLDQRRDGNSYHLAARWEPGTGLIVAGHDIGPGTAVMNDRGDYEYRYVIPPESIPQLLQLLGAAPDADIVTVLAGWTGPRAFDFERLNSELRTEFWSW